MRIALRYGCLGLISIGSLAGCGLMGSGYGDGYCLKNCPTERVVPQKPAPAVSTEKVIVPPDPVVIKPLQLPPAPIQRAPLPVLPDHDYPASKIEVAPALPVPAIKPSDNSLPANEDTTSPGKAETLPIQISDETPQAVIAPAIPASPKHDDANTLKGEPIQWGHTDDFKSVTGQIQLWRQTVRLRYAPVDQEDPYGGFVVLQGDGEVAKLREGQHVRVRGILIAPENRNHAANFKVQAIDVLD
jgi:hypothetical protein